MPDKMGRLSADELREPDVFFRLTEAQFYGLPASIQAEVRYFEIRPRLFRVPAYRYRDWLKMAGFPAGASLQLGG